MINLVDYEAIGRRIKSYRRQAGLRQADLAEKLDVSVSYISQIEHGITEVSLKRLDEIALLVETKLQYLVADINADEQDYLLSEVYEKIQSWSKENRMLLINILDAIDRSI